MDKLFQMLVLVSQRNQVVLLHLVLFSLNNHNNSEVCSVLLSLLKILEALGLAQTVYSAVHRPIQLVIRVSALSVIPIHSAV